MAPPEPRGVAVAKQASTAKRAKPQRRINTGLTAFVAVVFLLIAGAATTVYWLESSYDPADDPFGRSELLRSVEMPTEQRDETASGDARDAGSATQDIPGDRTNADQDNEPRPKTAMADPWTDSDASGSERETAPSDGAQQQASEIPGSGDSTGVVEQPPTPIAPDSQTSTASEPVAEIAKLTPAPQPDLIKQSPRGPLPVISPEGRTPLAVYARPYQPSGRPQIAIVLTDLGMAEAKTLAAIQQLPGAITLAFNPYGRNLQDYVDQARAAGHEVMLEVPMEPLRPEANDPGNYALLTSLPTRTNLEHLDWHLGRFSGYVGVVNLLGDRFTTSEPHLRPVLEAVRNRGLMFLDRRTSPRSVAADIAADIGLPGADSDRQIDSQASRAAIGAQLNELERLARSNGRAVGIAYPYPVTIELLSEWARGLRVKGIDLVPASALVRATG